jgi:beta-phosphoglucomutase-like phosphatase (HAD superfamily)
MTLDVPPRIRGLIFDCDGTLVDSMPLHMEAWESSMRSHGGTYDHDFFFSRKGMNEEEIVAQYNACHGRDLDIRAVVADKHRHFRRHMHKLAPIRIVTDLVHRYENVLPMAVVSGGKGVIVRRELEVIGMRRLFRAILTADDPFKQKPAPDMFLAAAKLLAVPPSLCQVFEDGDLGLSAAVAAGMLATDVRPFLCP